MPILGKSRSKLMATWLIEQHVQLAINLVQDSGSKCFLSSEFL